MPGTRNGRGCVVAAGCVLAGWAHSALPQEIAPVHALRFEVAYSVEPQAQPLDAVELWYQGPDDSGWQLYGNDADRSSPVTFEAPVEGEYALFLILTNVTGSSSHPPDDRTTPHLRVLVDGTAPVVQLHDLRPATSLGRRVLQVRWTAVDAHLPTRPVTLEFRPESAHSGNGWRSVTPEPIANTGRFDWQVPDDLAGRVSVRVVVIDAAGHRTRSEPASVTLSPGGDVASAAPPTHDVRARLVADAGPAAVSGSKRAKELARQLLGQAITHRQRGAYRDGVSRLREAVRLDPELTEAFAEMGGLLFVLGDLDRALTAYAIALEQEPHLRSALAGAAKIYTRKKKYDLAADRLRTILRYDPGDAEMWMALGDVAVYQGDEMLAREAYMRAAQVDPRAVDVIEEARKRLALMAEASRTYEAGGS